MAKIRMVHQKVVSFRELIGTQLWSHQAVFVEKIIMGTIVESLVLFGLAIIKKTKKTEAY